MRKKKIYFTLCSIILSIWPSYVSFSLEMPPEKIYQKNINNYNNKCIFFTKYFEKRLQMPDGILSSISSIESSLRPWTVNIKGKPYYFSQKDKAVTFIKKKMKLGIKSIDVGCMQINLYHHEKAFQNIEEAINPKTNISYAALLLKKKYKRNYNWVEAIAHYHSRHSKLGKKYARKVLKVWKSYKLTK